MTETLSPDILDKDQIAMIDFVRDVPKCALWVDMGAGKTVSVLTAVDEFLNCAESLRVLVIAPLRVAKTTWPDEIKLWSHVSGNTYQVISGSEEGRLKAMRTPADLHFINVENVTWLVNKLKRKWPYDTVIIDEASLFRNSDSKRFMAVKKIIPFTHRVIQMTGTPGPKGKDDQPDLLAVWSQVFLLDGGERLGKTFTMYKQQYFKQDYMRLKWDLRPGAREEILDKIKDLVLSIEPKDFVPVRPLIENVELPKSAREIYRELEKEFIVTLDSKDVVEAANAAVLQGKLQQVANGALYVDDKGAFEEVHTAKLDALERIIERHKGEPMLIAYQFRSDLARILKRFPEVERFTDDTAQKHKWDRGEIAQLASHPQSMGYGLNMQKGGHIAVWFGDTWNLEYYQQFNKRLPRRGQKADEVLIYHIRAQNTVDQPMELNLINRNKSQKWMLEYIRNDIIKRHNAC